MPTVLTAANRPPDRLGYPGGELAVQRYLRRFRQGRGPAPQPGPNRQGHLQHELADRFQAAEAN
jgi:hypothetical protein